MSSEVANMVFGQALARSGPFQLVEPAESTPQREQSPLSVETLAELVHLAVHSTPQRLLERVQTIARSERMTTEAVLFDCIGPVANRLGQCWGEDRLSFGDVTFGAGTLQRVVAEIGYEAEGPLLHRELVVLIAAPGEQHVLPIYAIGEAVRAEGWETHVAAQMDHCELLDLVATEDVCMVGVTCKDLTLLAGLESFVSSVQEASISPVDFVLGGSSELEPFASTLGFSFVPSGRELCSRLASRIAPC